MRNKRRAVGALLALLGSAPMCMASPSPGAGVHAQQSLPAPAFGAYLAARLAASEADVGFAAAEYLKAVAADPSNLDLVRQAFATCVLAGRPEAARLALRLPDNPVAQLLLFDAELRAGNWEAAERRARAIPSQGLTQAVQPVLLAWAQQGAGHTDAALATLRPYTDGARMRGVYLLHAAMIADLGGRSAEAARLYRATQTSFEGTNLRLAQVVASWEARQGRLGEAQRMLAATTAGSPAMTLALPALVASSLTRPVARATDGVAEAYLALAAAVREQDAVDLSMLLLRLALELRPDFTPARLLMADVMEGTRHPEAAVAVLAPVTDQDPMAGVVRLNRAALANRIGHPDEALKLLEKLSHDYPDSPAPEVEAGDILREKNRYPEAIEAYGRAIARTATAAKGDGIGNSWVLYYARGVAYERSHQWPDAETDFKHALQLAPDQPIVLNYLGYSWADQGTNLTQARQMIDAALKQRPDDGAIIDSLGWVTLRQGDPQAAVKLLERAVELQPEDPTINGHLGDAYWAVGRRLEATFQWRRALSLNPEPEDAARIEVRLHDTAALADPPAGDEHRIQ